MIPGWLHGLSIAYLSLGALAAMTIAADEIKHPQHMWIMNVVWPVTALFGTVWIVWQYFTYGRLAPPPRPDIPDAQARRADGKGRPANATNRPSMSEMSDGR